MKVSKKLQRIIAILLCMIMVILTVPCSAMADEPKEKEKEEKTVRVGWYDSALCYYDSFGRRCGIDYEYQQKISAYTGWNYEYVEDSWPNLLQKLKDGEIDLLSDVSYKPDREKDMYFADLPMGTEAYYIFIGTENREIAANDLSTFNGTKIGVNKGSIQETFLREWKEKNELNFEILPLTLNEKESMDMITRNEVDGYASVFSFETDAKAIPVCRIGGSDYFYAVNKDRKDLLDELNMALAEIQDEDPYFNQKISEERLYKTRTNAMIAPKQEDWVKEHGTIRIGYRENYLPFCGTDEETGEITGALKDFLAHAENNLNSSNLRFEPVPYESTEAALQALSAGEIDCAFPVCLSSYDADQMGIRLTDPAMKTEMNAIMRTSDRKVLSSDSTARFAVNEGMINIDTFIMERYPKVKRTAYAGLENCYEAVADGREDCVLVSNYRIPSEEDTLKKYGLFTVPTGETLSFSFAVRKADRDLYFLLNKMVLITKTEEMDAALASYMASGQKVGFIRFLKEYWLIVIAVLFLIFFVILLLLGQKLRAERLATRQRRMLEEVAEIEELKQTITSLLDNMPGMNYTKDAKTGEYLACNQAFASYAHKKSPSEVLGLTAGDLFDEETAKRFIEDDKTALSMDEPLIFYENMPDEDGNPRQFKMTKLKYTDANGRLCVLGIFQDLTDNFRISRERVTDKESYEKARKTGIVFTHMAEALARGYIDLFYVDVNSEEFIEYRSDTEDGSLAESRRGWHFFEECRDVAEKYVYQEDLEDVLRALDRQTLMSELEKNNTFIMTFRIIRENGTEPVYVSLKVARMQDEERFIIFSLTDVDEQMKHRHAAQRMQEEQIAYDRISALAGEFLNVYVMDPESGWYREYSAVSGEDHFNMPSEGTNFFSDFREKTIQAVYTEDQNRFFTALSMENVMEEVENNGIFTLSYRLVMGDEPRYVQLKAAMVEEQEGRRLVIGINDIDAQVRQEEEYGRRLAQARIEANIDALTGVKNRNAYRVYEERMNAQIEMDRAPEFAIVILDVNDLKKVNDNEGHKAGDQYLRDACKIICTTFKRSPVFRVGGDEFAVLSQGDDYERIDELIGQMHAHNEDAIKNGGIIIALGMAKHAGEEKVSMVYEKADQLMYENKSDLKSRKK